MKLAALQIEIRDTESKRERLDRVLQQCQQLQGMDLVMLPEIWATGYFAFDRYKQEAETMDGEFVRLMSEQARQLGSWFFAGSFIEEENGSFYNTSLLFDRQGNLCGKYRKMHLFRYGSQEGEILTPGNGIGVFDTEWGKIGLTTCFDLRFPELYRAQLDEGATLFLVTSAWPHRRLEHWKVFNRARALENQCFLISCNAAGTNQGVTYAGHSQVVDPWGVVIASAGEEETVLRTEINLDEVERIRESFQQIHFRMLKSK